MPMGLAPGVVEGSDLGRADVSGLRWLIGGGTMPMSRQEKGLPVIRRNLQVLRPYFPQYVAYVSVRTVVSSHLVSRPCPPSPSGRMLMYNVPDGTGGQIEGLDSPGDAAQRDEFGSGTRPSIAARRASTVRLLIRTGLQHCK
jgi:hypothetical protein